MPEKYRRPSKKLVELRQSAHTLARANKFEEANALKVEADNLAMKEHTDAKKRLDADYEVAKKKLLKKHHDELAQLQETSKEQRELIISKKEGTEKTLQRRKIVLDSKPGQKKSRAVSKIQNQPLYQTTNSNQPRGVKTRSAFTGDQKLPPLDPPNQRKYTAAEQTSTTFQTQAAPASSIKQNSSTYSSSYQHHSPPHQESSLHEPEQGKSLSDADNDHDSSSSHSSRDHESADDHKDVESPHIEEDPNNQPLDDVMAQGTHALIDS